jgi:hypothetical protein
MKDQWKTLATEKPSLGTWVLVWDSKRNFASVAKHGKIAWQASGFSISFAHGTHWMQIQAPEIEDAAVGRRCSVCKELLPVALFSKTNRYVDGLSHRCKGCDSTYGKSAGCRNSKSQSSKWADATASRIEATQ